MRTGSAIFAAVALVAMLGAPAGWSQNTQAAVDGTAQPTPRSIQMVPARAELSHGFNAKKIKAGDPVTAKLEQTITMPSEPALKKDTVLLGRIDSVQASQHHSNSKVVITFSQAKLKNGTEFPVKVTVVAVSDPEITGADDMGGPVSAGGVPAGGAPGPGIGGPGSAPASGAPGSPAMPSAEPMAGPGVPSANSLQSNRGIPGVMLQSSIHGSASATFISKGRNVDVPSGIQMQLAIAIIPKGVQVH